MSPHFRCDKSEIILQLPHGGVWAGKQIRWSSEEQYEWAGFGYVPQREKWVMERKENAQRRVQSEVRVTGNTCSRRKIKSTEEGESAVKSKRTQRGCHEHTDGQSGDATTRCH